MGGKQLGFPADVLTVDKDSGLIHSVVTTAANVQDLSSAAELRHGDEEVVCGDSGYQGIATRPVMAGHSATPGSGCAGARSVSCLPRWPRVAAG